MKVDITLYANTKHQDDELPVNMENFMTDKEDMDVLKNVAALHVEDGQIEISKTAWSTVKSHEYYGNGTWDRVSYDAGASTTIKINTTRGKIKEAVQAVEEAVQTLNADAVAACKEITIVSIRQGLYPDLF